MGLVAALLLYLLDYKIIQSISHSVPTKSVAHSLSALTPILCLPHTVPLPSTPLVYEVLPRPFHHLLFGLFANLVRQAALPPHSPRLPPTFAKRSSLLGLETGNQSRLKSHLAHQPGCWHAGLFRFGSVPLPTVATHLRSIPRGVHKLRYLKKEKKKKIRADFHISRGADRGSVVCLLIGGCRLLAEKARALGCEDTFPRLAFSSTSCRLRRRMKQGGELLQFVCASLRASAWVREDSERNPPTDLSTLHRNESLVSSVAWCVPSLIVGLCRLLDCVCSSLECFLVVAKSSVCDEMFCKSLCLFVYMYTRAFRCLFTMVWSWEGPIANLYLRGNKQEKGLKKGCERKGRELVFCDWIYNLKNLCLQRPLVPWFVYRVY